MSVQQITAKDIAGWDSLQDISNSFEKRGLKTRPNLGEDNELVLQLDDDEFVVLVNAGPGETATDFKPDNRSRHTNLVATNDFEEFTFLTRMRSWDGQQHGRIKHQKISFTKAQFTSDSGEKNTVLKKLNSIEYGSSTAIYDTLYDTQQVVKEFYEEFEELRMNLVQEVSGIPDDRGDAKQRYVQVILDRMIFLYFIQEKRLLDRNPNYLHEQPVDVVDDGEDQYENFYRPLFFDYLAEDKQNPDFGSLPYLNGGLFAKNPVEEEFPDAKLGASAEETNELFDDILEFLSGWNWNVDERLDIVDPKNLSPAILGHIFEKTVNQKEMGAYYTPEEITGYMSRRTVHPYLLDRLNEELGTEYDDLDAVFGFTETGPSNSAPAATDGGATTQQVPISNVETSHVETLYHDILKNMRILDPGVGSGAFLLAAQEVLLDIYLQCIEYFQLLEDEDQGWEASARTRDELEQIDSRKANESLYAKRSIILNNLYGVDIDQGAVEICKLRLWLSMVADLQDEPGEVDPLPNIDFNIQQGNSLIGYVDTELDVGESGETDLNGWEKKTKFDKIRKSIQNHKNAETVTEARDSRNEAKRLIEEYRPQFDELLLKEFQQVADDDVTIDELRSWSPIHWPLQFADVYEGGGFDVVIGNPPYEGQDRTGYKKHLRERATKRYGHEYSAKTDMFQFFAHRGSELVKEGGYYSFIINDTFLMNRNKADVRQTVLPDLLEVTTVNPDAFDVSIETAIYTVKKGKSPTTTRYNASRDAPIASYTQLLEVGGFEPATEWGEYSLSTTQTGPHRSYEFNKRLYEESFRNVFYEPSARNISWYQRFFTPVMEMYTNWEKEIGNVRSLRANRTEVCRDYLQELKTGDICLFGLYAEGGRGVKTDDITEYVGVKEGTRKEAKINEQGYYNRSDSQITTIVSPNEIAAVGSLTDEEKRDGINGTPHWVPAHRSIKTYDKFYAPTDEYFDWSEQKITKLREKTSLTNSEAYFKRILATKQGGGVRNATWRIFDPGVVLNTVLAYQPLTPDTGSDFEFSSEEIMSLEYVMGILNSSFIDELMDSLLNRVGQTTVGTRLLPIVVPTENQEQRVVSIVEDAIELQKERNEQLEKPNSAKMENLIEQLDEVVQEIYGLEPVND
ncbi:Eco57I restriction-modification methylase domain-containing protein [Halorubrum tropicale]|uniref:Eco57I restriction-modification methylase domain-containing protein n=1 Tax=Halorubrum tropicale TaxID=1765655 RepID=UPI0009EB9AAD|nr:DNA methyltransferase [Halorubrum tropicale]